MRVKITNWIISPLPEDWNYNLTEIKPIRTLPQNALYWGVFLPQIVEKYREMWIDWTCEDWHDVWKDKFLSRRRKDLLTNRRKKKEWSTTELNTKQFKDYMERISQYLISTIQWSPRIDNITEDDLLYWESII